MRNFSATDRYVYAIDDEQGEPCYIGVGKGNRLRHHVRDAKTGRTDIERRRFFTGLYQKGFVIQPYKVAEELTLEQAYNYERTLIVWYGRRDLGTGNLLNITDGGEGIAGAAASTRALKSRQGKAQMTSERRAQIGQETRERHADPEFKAYHAERTRLAMKALSPERKQEISENRRLAMTPEILEAANQKRIITTNTPEFKTRQVEGTKRQIEKYGHHQTGKPVLEETKAKISHTINTNEKTREILASYWTKEHFLNSIGGPKVAAAARARGQKASAIARMGAHHSEETKIKMRKTHNMSPEGLVVLAEKNRKQVEGKPPRSTISRNNSREGLLNYFANNPVSDKKRANMKAARLRYLALQKQKGE